MNDYPSFREGAKEGASLLTICIGAIVGVFVLAAIIWALSFAFGWFTAGPNGKLQAKNQINSGANRIAQYDKFFNLCASVQTAEVAITSLKEQLAAETSADDKSITRTNITANEVARAEAVNTYNQDAAATYTQGQFLASNLPFRLPITIPTGGTQCAP